MMRIAAVLLASVLSAGTAVAQERTVGYPSTDVPRMERAEYGVLLGFSTVRLADRYAYDFSPSGTALEEPFHIGGMLEFALDTAGTRTERFSFRADGYEEPDRLFRFYTGQLSYRRSMRNPRAHNPWRYIGLAGEIGAGLQHFDGSRENDTTAVAEIAVGVEFGLSAVSLEFDAFARQSLPIDVNGEDRAPLLYGIRMTTVIRVGPRRWMQPRS